MDAALGYLGHEKRPRGLRQRDLGYPLGETVKWRDHKYEKLETVLEEVVNDQAVEVYGRIWVNMTRTGVPNAFATWREPASFVFLRGWQPVQAV